VTVLAELAKSAAPKLARRFCGSAGADVAEALGAYSVMISDRGEGVVTVGAVLAMAAHVEVSRLRTS
jgi:hypothetical protein